MKNQRAEAKNGEKILEARARILARPPQVDIAEEETLHLLSLLLGQERYGVDIRFARETQPLDERNWAPVPCTPDFVVGAVNIRGRIHPIMDVARFLGLPPRPVSETAHVLLVRGSDGEGKEMELSLLADTLPQTVHVLPSDVTASTVTISARAQEFIRGVTDDMLIILDIERLLSDPGIVIHEEV